VEEFASLRLVLVGAEKLRGTLAKAFEEKYGVALLEGYGATETAPVIAANRPDFVAPGFRQLGTKSGTVGQPVPGVAVKVVDLDTEAPLPYGQEGMLLVKGPNVMQGYLGQPQKTAEALRDGWYVTGDVGLMDDDGFIHITDRLSRFSKIGGEMVPHIRIEQIAADMIIGGSCALTAVPDERKGEQLVLFYTCRETSPDELWKKLSGTDLPKLWIPKREALFLIEEIPTLGTGKTDLKRLRVMAVERLLEPAELPV
jgi:acyl-[acyl-carrier-protein]-phospholipid O-acyltransferase/long-chain-fatty-acid--[acyl-carrier-protein] ligase